MKLTPLIAVADFNPSPPRGLMNSAEEAAFVPMAAVSELGSMRVAECRPACEFSKGLTYFRSADVLVAKITPCYENNKITVAHIDQSHGFGSTEFHVLRPVPELLDSKYLSYFLRQDSVRESGTKRMTGSAGQRRLPKAFLEQLEIPLPPLDQQQRIVSILEQADGLRHKRRTALRALSGLKSAIFEASLGDLSRWPVTTFGHLVSDTRLGLVRGAGEFGEGMQFPYVRMNAITREGEFDFSTIKTTNASDQEIESHSLRDGDFLFNTRNSRDLVGKSAIWRGSSSTLFNNNIMRIRFNKSVNAEYIHSLFSVDSTKHQLDIRKTGTTSVFAIYWRDLQTLPVPLPTIERQASFASAVVKIGELRARGLAHLASLDVLFTSLQHRAFLGEL